ncbi:hypothetical protein CLV84_0647 [Neolewinella xylanilytica]|uniref:Lipoprotein n=1 Tax=Neolewinella xylanilytica TaxID=1514080 RepID=A0A2S6I872_9BACT|nr:hypothetical protein [Neolewinella xylanilytica]PPK87697.1 hypothetical protein CLV84_0647 [Neolewinella xylanilytica]
MKKLSVYPVFLILLGFSILFMTGCSRKSGCAALMNTTKVQKKNPGGNRDLFGQRM